LKEFSLDQAYRVSRIVLLMLTALLLLGSPGLAIAQDSTPAASPEARVDSGAAALHPGERQRVLEKTEGFLSSYLVTARLRSAGPLPATIGGTLDLTYVNGTGIPQSVIYFRLYPNNEDYAEGGISLSNVRVEGQVAPVTLSTADTTAEIPLPRTVKPGGSIDLSLDFTTTIPTDPAGGYGMFQYDSVLDAYALAQWLPLLAGWDPERGWNLDPLSVMGDPTFTDAAFFEIAMTASSELVFASSGVEIERQENGAESTFRIVSGPVRDFVMAASPNFLISTAEVDGTTVRSFYFPETPEAGERVLADSAESLRIFNELFGPYPYQQLDVVQIDLQNRAAGVEFAGIIYIANNLYYFGTRELEFTVVHEVAHQWWYGLVGNNQYYTAFLDEGLTNYSSIIYWEERYGAEMAELMINAMLKRPYFAVLFGPEGDQIAYQPTDGFVSPSAYGGIIYGKAPLGFRAIREEIGDEAFFETLWQFRDQFEFRVATPDDLLALFEEVSGQKISDLWEHWFESADGDQDFGPEDLQEVLGR
jgi:hypothetical protein